MDICVVRLEYGSYTSTETVTCDSDADDEHVIAAAWKMVKKWLTLPMAYRSAKIISRKHCN
jgi:hypothetical protein